MEEWNEKRRGLHVSGAALPCPANYIEDYENCPVTAHENITKLISLQSQTFNPNLALPSSTYLLSSSMQCF